MILIKPDEVAEAERRIDVTSVPSHVVLASDEHSRDGAARGGVDITVPGVIAALIDCGDQCAVDEFGREAKAVGAGLEIIEAVVAEAVGDVSADGDARAVIQGDADAGDAWLVAVLDAIAVGVAPDTVTDAGERRVVSDIPGRIIFTRGERGQSGAARDL